MFQWLTSSYLLKAFGSYRLKAFRYAAIKVFERRLLSFSVTIRKSDSARET